MCRIEGKQTLLGFRSEGHEGLETPKSQDAEFALQYGGMHVGKLVLDKGEWVFHYSPEFLNQSQLKPLVDFPDPAKVYRSEDLWPFFIHRIPSVAQPSIRETIEEEGLDVHNEVALLARFGRHAISNPFVLEPLQV